MTCPPDDIYPATATVPQETLRVFISGFVQSVGFRQWLQKQAQKRGINGWCRNRADGRVEAIFSGPSRAVSDFLRACRHGPDLARVDAVQSAPDVYDGLEGFRIVENE